MNIKDLLGNAYKEGITVEEIETALKDITLPKDNTAQLERLKNALSKSNSEAADYKKQLREKMTEDEAAKQKELEERRELQSKYEKLRDMSPGERYKFSKEHAEEYKSLYSEGNSETQTK